jgi:hypothetical protein
MSDTSQGPGWWLASDGKWYPPEQWTGPPNTSPPGGQATPSQAWTAGPTQPQPGSIFPTGGPPVYGATPYPGSAPPAQPVYGAPQYGQPVYVAPGGSLTNGLAIASFVCSIIGFLFVTFIVGIVLGFVARSQIRNSTTGQKGDGLAIAGIVIGFAWLAFFVLIFALGPHHNTTNSVIDLAGVIGHIA